MSIPKQISAQSTVSAITTLLEELEHAAPFPAALKRASLSEHWFSDRLAWLLDPSGSHNLSTDFANEFLKTIARARTHGHEDGSTYYHRAKYLRWHRSKKPGTHSTQFDLRNAAVYREFYLSGLPRGGKIGKGMLCDVVFLDLDPQDGIMVSIENKLFTTNHPGQLERYYEIVEKRYVRAKVSEYVYLTLLGDPPKHVANTESKKCAKRWVRLSWVGDILDILEKIKPDGRNRSGVHDVIAVLRWLKAATAPYFRARAGEAVEGVLRALIAEASNCLVDELYRLNEGARGEWSVKGSGKTRTRIGHSSKPSKFLYVGVKPNLSFVIYSNKRESQSGSNLIIPFGSSVDQTYNLLDLAARDIFPWYFGGSFRHYLGKARRLRTMEAEVRSEARGIFEFANELSQQIRLLIALTRVGEEYVLLEEETE